MSDYFVGHGKVYAAQRDVDGDPTGFLDLGNCPSFVLTPGNRGFLLNNFTYKNVAAITALSPNYKGS